MKIALYHNLPSGGARRAMVEMVKGLVARGHAVDEYCPETADLSFLPLGGHVHHTTVLPFRPLGVARRRVPALTPYITAARLVHDLRSMAALGQQAAQRIDRQDYDVVFSHDCQLVFAPDVLRFLRHPSVHYCHAATSATRRNVESDRNGVGFLEQVKRLYYAPARSVYPWLRVRRTQRNLKAAGQVLTNSDLAAAELRQAFGVASQVCHLGVDVERFRPLGLPREAFVLSVGAVHYHKGYRFLVRALGQIAEDRRPALVIAANSADPAEQRTVEELAARHGLDLTIRRVTVDDELTRLYNQASAFVYAPVMEPWGLAPVEAMACGTPVIAVREGGVRESVLHGETGWLTEREETAFAEAVSLVLSDQALARRLGAAGAVRAREVHTWARTIDRLEALLAIGAA